MKRKHISLKVKLAAALLQMQRVVRRHGGTEVTPLIPFSEAQRLTADQIIALFDFNHYPIPHAQEGPDEPWNLVPVIRAEHREVTAKVDIPQIAKTKRITKEQEAFRQLMLTPRDQRPEKKSRWGSRPFNNRRKDDQRKRKQ